MTERTILFAMASCAALLLHAATTQAKPARCFTTDDGHYPCDFRGFGGDGSFVISAPGKPTFSLTMERRGVAYGTINIYGKATALPGRYFRSKADPACWVNDATNTKICAW
jgi:hypothetical protein